MKTPTKSSFSNIRRQFQSLLVRLKPEIGDDYRCSDDPDDNEPGMTVTFGAKTVSDGTRGRPTLEWSYQTGDNSFAGSAYGYPFWAVVNLYRKSNCTELAREAVDEIENLIAEAVEMDNE